MTVFATVPLVRCHTPRSTLPKCGSLYQNFDPHETPTNSKKKQNQQAVHSY